MKKNIIKAVILVATIITGISVEAYAKVDGYLLKDDTNTIYNYNFKELKDSLINNALGNNDPLFSEFETNLKRGQFYLLHDSDGKYVSYEVIKKVLIEKTLNQENFDLETEVRSAKTEETPEVIENIRKENNQVIKELVILKEGTVLDGSNIVKDKYKKVIISVNNVTISNLDITGDIILNPGNLGKVKIDNVKCNLINILSGDKKGIVFNKVESKEVKIDKNLDIEVQNNSGGSTGNSGTQPGNNNLPNQEETLKQASLTQAKAEIDSLISNISNASQRQILQQISSGISQAMADKDYDFTSNMTSALNSFKSLELGDQISLFTKMYEEVDLENINKLMDFYNIDRGAIEVMIN